MDDDEFYAEVQSLRALGMNSEEVADELRAPLRAVNKMWSVGARTSSVARS